MEKSKKIIACVLLGAYCFVASGQTSEYDYLPLVEEGKSWKIEEYNEDHTQIEDEYTFYIAGDTLIEGQTWKRVFQQREGQQDIYYGAVLEDGQAIYALSPYSSVGYQYLYKYGIICDFSLHLGDALYTVTHDTPNDNEYQSTFSILPDAIRDREDHREVVSIDTITVRGKERRRFTMEAQLRTTSLDASERYQPTLVWVEGVGPETGLFVPRWKRVEDFRVTCMLNGDTIFESKDFHLAGEKYESRSPEPAPIEYLALVEEGKAWKVEVMNSEHTQVEDEYINYIQGDTLLEDQTWKKVHQSRRDEEDIYLAAVRQDGPLVYTVLSGYGLEKKRVIYDFSVKVGYGLFAGYYLLPLPMQYYLNNMEVIRIDTVTMNGQERRRYTLEARYRNQSATYEVWHPYLVWIEGVGSNVGLIVPINDMSAKFENYRVTCILNGEEIFRMGDFTGTDGIEEVQSPFASTPRRGAAIYDLQGRRLSNRPEKGVYIENGRKVMHK